MRRECVGKWETTEKEEERETTRYQESGLCLLIGRERVQEGERVHQNKRVTEINGKLQVARKSQNTTQPQNTAGKKSNQIAEIIKIS